jgi:hypothetical protein
MGMSHEERAVKLSIKESINVIDNRLDQYIRDKYKYCRNPLVDIWWTLNIPPLTAPSSGKSTEPELKPHRMIRTGFFFSSASAKRFISSTTSADTILSSSVQCTVSNSHNRFLSNVVRTNKMFTYDGIRSQLEWNSTLSVSNAPQPTADTKFLRKVSCLLTFYPLSNYNLADLDHRNYRCAICVIVGV